MHCTTVHVFVPVCVSMYEALWLWRFIMVLVSCTMITSCLWETKHWFIALWLPGAFLLHETLSWPQCPYQGSIMIQIYHWLSNYSAISHTQSVTFALLFTTFFLLEWQISHTGSAIDVCMTEYTAKHMLP